MQLANLVHESSLFQKYNAPLLIKLNKCPIVSKNDSQILAFGSCFASSISSYLNSIGLSCNFKRDVCRHFSTESLLNFLQLLGHEDLDVFHEYDDYLGGINPWQYAVGRSFEDKMDLQKRLYSMRQWAFECIQKCGHFVVTLGTNIVIRHLETNMCINTADKMPNHLYRQISLSADEIVSQLHEIRRVVMGLRSGKSFNMILTLSPQRYTFISDENGNFNTQCDDLFVQNSLSKSICRCAIDTFVRASDGCHYFPAYEIVVDELRRFEHFNDNLHIDPKYAPGHVVSRFIDTYFDDNYIVDIVKKNDLGRQSALLAREKIVSVGEHFFSGEKLHIFLEKTADAIHRLNYSFLFSYYFPACISYWGEGAARDFISLVICKYKRVCFWGISGRFDQYFKSHVSSDSVLVDTYKHGVYVEGHKVIAPDDLVRVQIDAIVICSAYREEIVNLINSLNIESVVL